MADETSTDEIYEYPQELSEGQSETSSEAVYENPQKPSEGQSETSSEVVYENTQELSEDNGNEPTAYGLWQLLVLVGILCVLLVVSISIIIWISVEQKKQKAALREQTERMTDLENLTELLDLKNRNLENLTEMLVLENKFLKNETEQLKTERDDLNHTLEVILMFDNFPVKDFCPNKKCQPCLNSWVQFRDSCYLFYKDFPWKTWEESRQFCQDKSSDLVVINDLQEQEFVSNHSEPYYDNAHGYWLGLRNINNIWVWVDGHNDTLGYWVTEEISTDPCALLIPTGPDENLNLPRRNLTQTWDTAYCAFDLRFICELRALIKSS